MTTTSGAVSPDLKFGNKQLKKKSSKIKPMDAESTQEETKAKKSSNFRKKNDKSIINEETENGKR